MANQRSTFAKRRRETELQDKARAKRERRAAKRGEQRPSKGPEIAWDLAVVPVTSSDDDTLPVDPAATPDPAAPEGPGRDDSDDPT